jgi:2-methylcitrate dehydratase PrpD
MDSRLTRIFFPEVEKKWGKPWELIGSGITIKKYPCCAGNHSSLDVMLKLASENDIRPEEVKKITCEVPGLVTGILHRHRPATALEARFSLEFAMAAAVVERAAGLKQYADERVNDPLIRSVMEKVETKEMEMKLMSELDGGDLKGRRVTVELEGVRKIEGETGEARGHMGDPLTDLELAAKFRECAEGILPDGNIRRALSLIEGLDDLEDIRDITGLFRV